MYDMLKQQRLTDDDDDDFCLFFIFYIISGTVFYNLRVLRIISGLIKI